MDEAKGVSRIIEVGLGGRAYQVRIAGGLIDRAGFDLAELLPRKRTVVVTDSHVEALHGARLVAAFAKAGIGARTIILPPGEETKSFHHLEALCDALLAEGLDRGALFDFLRAEGAAD